MKRRLAIMTLAIMMLIIAAPGVFAAGTLTVEKSSPKDGQKGMAVDNTGIKIYFSEDVYSKANYKSNAAACKMVEIITKEVDGKTVEKVGKTIKTKVVFNREEKNVMMILAVQGKTKQIKDNTKYRVTVDDTFKSTAGNTLAKPIYVTFQTLNSKSSMTISFVMMGVMVVGMIFFTSRSMKKEANKEKKEEPVNPYKVAKETGKSVKEIVENEAKKKAKQEAKKKRQKEENKVEIASDNFRVKSRRPISAAGSTYKHPVPVKKEKPKNRPQKNNSKKKKK